MAKTSTTSTRKNNIRSTSFGELNILKFESNRGKYPNVPTFALAHSRSSDKTTNALTGAIVEFIRLKGGTAERINTQGQYDVRLKRFRPGSTRKGTPDVIGATAGRYLAVEVKLGRDKMSEHQLKRRDEIIRAGGLYHVAKNFPCFWVWYKLETSPGGTATFADLYRAAVEGNEPATEQEFISAGKQHPEQFKAIFGNRFIFVPLVQKPTA